ncbi:transposase [Vibrio japonicus]|uniref:transposase n=1 Tax=Vibrio japonicus TaxID=1824638 RepID=UPI003524FACE
MTYSSIWVSHGSLPVQNTHNNPKRYRKILKKLQDETILKIPGHVALKHVDIWFQDEARFGQQNTTTRLWAERGTRPRAVKQQQFEYAYLFGSVCPQKGIGEAIVVPWVNKDLMIEHLKQISAVTEKGRHTNLRKNMI